jgi:hypothetical protein
VSSRTSRARTVRRRLPGSMSAAAAGSAAARRRGRRRGRRRRGARPPPARRDRWAGTPARPPRRGSTDRSRRRAGRAPRARTASIAARAASLEPPHRAVALGVQDVDQVVGHGGPVRRGRLRGADVHAPVDGEGVHGDDLRAQARGGGQRDRALPAAVGPTRATTSGTRRDEVADPPAGRRRRARPGRGGRRRVAPCRTTSGAQPSAPPGTPPGAPRRGAGPGGPLRPRRRRGRSSPRHPRRGPAASAP